MMQIFAQRPSFSTCVAQLKSAALKGRTKGALLSLDIKNISRCLLLDSKRPERQKHLVFMEGCAGTFPAMLLTATQRGPGAQLCMTIMRVSHI